MDYNDIFADIVNVLLFDGRELVRPEDLTSCAPASAYRSMDGRLHEMERDVVKRWEKHGVSFSVLGIEHQSEPDSCMPARVIAYDGASYRSQLLGKAERKIFPVVTLVLYFGTKKHWNSTKSLLESMKDCPEEIRPYVSDYRINVFEIAWLPDETIEKFRSDFRVVARFFSEKRKNAEYIPQDRTRIRHVDEILKLISAVTGDMRYEGLLQSPKQSKKEVYTMCELFENTLQKGRAEGIAEGKAEGRLSMLVELVNKKLLTIRDAAAQLDISEEAFAQLMQHV